MYLATVIMIRNKRMVILIAFLLMTGSALTGCEFVDVVPDNVPTLKGHAFNTRANAKRFLYTCYSYMPVQDFVYTNPGFLAGGEIIYNWKYGGGPPTDILKGNQNITDPDNNYWEGRRRATDLYDGIRMCNIFLKNIGQVPDMTVQEKKQWSAEVKFLKAYYLFWMVRMYGPVYLPKKNVPVYAMGEAKVVRSPVDESFNYIVKLLDEAAPYLPDQIKNQVANTGRITKTIDYAVKALVLVTAASPLFNGNKDYAGFRNTNGKLMFNSKFDPARWDSAAAAAKKAIVFAQKMGYHLYHFTTSLTNKSLTDTTTTKMSIRGSLTKNWNSGVIWANTNSMEHHSEVLQRDAMPHGLVPAYTSTTHFPTGRFGVPLRIVKLFYTNHGVPIKQDKTWDYSKRLDFVTVPKPSRFNLIEGYTTAYMNLYRGSRFYADLGFDGSIWYGQGRYNDQENLFTVKAKNGQGAQIYSQGFSPTGYWPKKLVNYKTIINQNGMDIKIYAWPVIRLTGLYLLYAEAKNEADGPGPKVYKYINLVRKRAGFPTVQKAWSTYSTNPNQYKTKKGLRKIIHRERRIELAFEGKSFWALRRWKEAVKVFNGPLSGWSIKQSTPQGYYIKNIIYQQTFTTRDYLWPLREAALLSNENLKQNPGW